MSLLCWLLGHKLVFDSRLRGGPGYTCARCPEIFNDASAAETD